MDSHWVHNRPGYRCRHGHTSAHQPTVERPKTIYLREDHLIDSLTAHLGDFDDHTLHGHARIVASKLRNAGSIIIYHSEDGLSQREKKRRSTLRAPTQTARSSDLERAVG